MANDKKINPAKMSPLHQEAYSNENLESDYSSLQEMQREMTVFFSFLQVDNQNFTGALGLRERHGGEHDNSNRHYSDHNL